MNFSYSDVVTKLKTNLWGDKQNIAQTEYWTIYNFIFNISVMSSNIIYAYQQILILI